METSHLRFVDSNLASRDLTKSVMQFHFNGNSFFNYMLVLILNFTIHISINTTFSVETMNSTQENRDFLLQKVSVLASYHGKMENILFD